MKKIKLTERQLCDLELIMNGGFFPLKGFMEEEEYISVIENMRLPSGVLWPIPIILDVDNIDEFSIGDRIQLSDEYGKPIAIINISSIFKLQKDKEVESVYGTSNREHYGVNYIMNKTHKFALGGNVEKINDIDRFDFSEYRHTPEELKKWFKDNNWDKVCAFQTRNPIHKAHFYMIKSVYDNYGIKVLIHPSVGVTNDGDIDYITRVKSYIHIKNKYANDFSQISLLPLAMRMGGPKEALMHAIIRKNYGCTHFIVGRHHAEPKDSQGNDFYGAYDAQELVKMYEKDIGIEMIPFQEMVYVEDEDKYFEIDKINKNQKIKNISGTEFRKMISEGKEIPSWFSFTEVIEEIKKGYFRNNRDGLTIFFTGLPSSGKSTLAKHLYIKLQEIQERSISLLDGDVVRNNLSQGLGFSKDDRNINIERIGFVANEITKHGGIAICSAIAPYNSSRLKNRELISKHGRYIEIYLSTPLDICINRDVKGLYNSAQNNKGMKMTGIDDPYQVPQRAEIVIDTSQLSIKESIDKILKYLEENKIIFLKK